MQEYAEAAFKASVGVSVIQKSRWIDVSLTLFNGRAFVTNNKKCMNVKLTTKGLDELIQQLQKARETRFRELEFLQDEKPTVEGDEDDWSD